MPEPLGIPLHLPAPNAVPLLYAYVHCADHHAQEGHLEQPDRIKKVVELLEEYDDLSMTVHSTPATHEVLSRVHSAQYLDALFGTQQELQTYIQEKANDPSTSLPIASDVYVTQSTSSDARVAFAAVVRACQRMMQQHMPVAAFVRPPGHHAHSDYPKGFSFLNNAWGAVHEILRQTPNSQSTIVIIDTDYHHGCGTQQLVQKANSPRVVFISIHADGYPAGPGKFCSAAQMRQRVFNFCLPISPKPNDAALKRLWWECVHPILKHYKPAYIV